MVGKSGRMFRGFVRVGVSEEMEDGVGVGGLVVQSGSGQCGRRVEGEG